MSYSKLQNAAWYLAQCKPRQDERAQQHLENQGYTCYRPQYRRERVLRGRLQAQMESLFPGYLFIQLAGDSNWSPLRSTRGLSRIVAFNGQPHPLPTSLIVKLQQRPASNEQAYLQPGHRVRIIEGPFAELEGIYQGMSGEQRVIVLLNLLQQTQTLELPITSISKNA